MRIVIASTSILSHVTSGNSRATSAAISSHITMAWRCAFDLVTTVSSLRGRERASAKAKRMMRSTPARVMIETSVATSSGRPRCDAAADAGIFAFRILAHDHPVELRTGDTAQGAERFRAGRGSGARWRIDRTAGRSPAQAPERDVVGHIGRPGRAEKDGVMTSIRRGRSRASCARVS